MAPSVGLQTAAEGCAIQYGAVALRWQVVWVVWRGKLLEHLWTWWSRDSLRYKYPDLNSERVHI